MWRNRRRPRSGRARQPAVGVALFGLVTAVVLSSCGQVTLEDRQPTPSSQASYPPGTSGGRLCSGDVERVADAPSYDSVPGIHNVEIWYRDSGTAAWNSYLLTEYWTPGAPELVACLDEAAVEPAGSCGYTPVGEPGVVTTLRLSKHLYDAVVYEAATGTVVATASVARGEGCPESVPAGQLPVPIRHRIDVDDLLQPLARIRDQGGWLPADRDALTDDCPEPPFPVDVWAWDGVGRRLSMAHAYAIGENSRFIVATVSPVDLSDLREWVLFRAEDEDAVKLMLDPSTALHLATGQMLENDWPSDSPYNLVFYAPADQRAMVEAPAGEIGAQAPGHVRVLYASDGALCLAFDLTSQFGTRVVGTLSAPRIPNEELDRLD